MSMYVYHVCKRDEEDAIMYLAALTKHRACFSHDEEDAIEFETRMCACRFATYCGTYEDCDSLLIMRIESKVEIEDVGDYGL